MAGKGLLIEISYIFQDTFEVEENFLVSEPYDMESHFLKVCSPLGVIFLLGTLGMITSVHLNYKTSVSAYEVNDVGTDNVLSKEFYTLPFRSQCLP